MIKFRLILLFVLLPLLLGAEEKIIVPQSDQPLKKSYLFLDQSRSELILLYEKLTEPKSILVIERRQVEDRSIIQRFSLSLPSGQTTRLADYVASHSVLLGIVQQNSTQALSIIAINVLSKSVVRSPFFTVEEARRNGVSAGRLSVAGMTWDKNSNREPLLINASSASSTVAFFASVDSNGHQIGAPSPLSRHEKHTDLALNSCTSSFAATTTTAVKLLKGNRVRAFRTPEEIAFDPDLCRFAIIRRQFSEIPQIYFLDASLNTQQVFTLPGGVAPGLIEDTRNQLVYSGDRKSFFYPTVLSHAQLSLNEITQQGVKSVAIPTSVDVSGVSVTTFGDRVFLLVAGLRVRSFERIHQLILVSTSPPQN